MYIRDAEKHFGGNIPDEATLQLLVDNDDHRMELDEDDDRHGAYIHIHWACDTCAAEAIISHRRYLEESTLPGALPYLGPCSNRNIPASEVVAGMFVRHRPYPGMDYSWYVECLAADSTDDGVTVTWKKTNADEETPFTVFYPAELRFTLSVWESLNRTSPSKPEGASA